MVDKRHRACGEVVASDTWYIRILLTCAVDHEKRRVKIRRGSNKQDAYLPGDVSLTAVTFDAFQTAPDEQLHHYGCNRGGVHAPPQEEPPQEAIDAAEAQREMMLLRNNVEDDRPLSALADAILVLLCVRSEILGHSDIPLQAAAAFREDLDDKSMKMAFNDILKAKFLEEVHDHDDSDVSKRKCRKRMHGRFHAWLHLRFGQRNRVRAVIREGIRPEVVLCLQGFADDGEV